MSNQYVIYNSVQKFKELETEVKWQLIIVTPTRRSADAKRLHDAPCRW